MTVNENARSCGQGAREDCDPDLCDPDLCSPDGCGGACAGGGGLLQVRPAPPPSGSNTGGRA
ncbi:hypothetical protein [Planotetraspora sp. GP83]|uniref:hypothetical protein n=1 Tax=Planotetraspora sp. GP83 TaxID=3156264 RepID=UPI0035144450